MGDSHESVLIDGDDDTPEHEQEPGLLAIVLILFAFAVLGGAIAIRDVIFPHKRHR